jgi:hypothetical protein
MAYTFGKKMTPKKLLLPPILPVALLLLLCAWVFYSEAIGEVRMIDGRPDNAPARASVFLAMLSPLIYIFFAIFNVADSFFDRLSVKASWIGTSALVIVVGLLLSLGLYAPQVDSSPVFALAAGFGVSLAIFVPMSAIRRCVIRSLPKSKNAEQVSGGNGGQSR